MKKTFSIIGKILLVLLVTVYVAVALLNISIVQSIAGSIASSSLSKDWGGTVRVGSMGVNLAGGVTLRNVQLITPANDTIASVSRISVRFNKPIQPSGVHLKSVFIGRTYFHLEDQEDGLTILQFVRFITSRFASNDEEEQPGQPQAPFVLRIDNVYASHLNYKQTLELFQDSTTFPGIRVPNMWFKDISFRARNLRIDTSPRITLQMDNFSAKEASGMNVKSLKMNAYVAQDAIAANDLELTTDSSNIKCDVLMKYRSFETFEHFLDSVVMHVTLKEGTCCNMADAAYWTSTLWRMHEQVGLRGIVFGTIADLRVPYMDITTGQHTHISMSGSVTGLPEIDRTFIDVDIHNVVTNYDDLAALSWSDDVKVDFPKLIAKLGNIDATAGLHGTVKDFTGDLSAQTDAGSLQASVEMLYDEALQSYKYTASANSPSFQLAQIAKNDWVSRSGFEVSVQGTGFRPRTMRTQALVTLYNTQIRGVPMKSGNATVDANEGIIIASAALDDSLINGNIWAMADLKDSVGSYEISGMVRNLDLKALHLWNREVDTAAVIRGQLQTHFYGNSIESLYGSMVLDNTELTLNHQPLKMKSAAMTIRTAADSKNIFFTSDICNAWVRGYFQYTDLPIAINRFTEHYAPQYFQPNPNAANNPSAISHNSLPADQVLANVDLEFGIQWKDTLDAMSVLMPDIMIAPGTVVHGNYNYAEQLKLVLRSDSIAIGGAHLYDMGMNGSQRGYSFGIDLHTERLALNKATLMEDIRITAQSNSQEAGVHLLWNNHADTIQKLKRGDIALKLTSSDTGNWIQVTQGTMSLNGDHWQVRSKKPIFFSKQQMLVEELKGQCDKQSIVARAKRVHDSSDFAEFSFEGFDLTALNSLLQSTGIEFGGSLTGNVELQGLDNTPHLQADLRIDSTTLGHQPLGVTRVLSSWDPRQDIVSLYLTTALTQSSGTIAPVVAVGELDLGHTTPTTQQSTGSLGHLSSTAKNQQTTTNGTKSKEIGVDFYVEFNSFQLQLLQPMLSSVLSELQGGLKGKFNVSGTTKKPVVDGIAYISGGAVRTDMLNVRYTFDDSININNKAITLNQFALHDSLGNVAYLNGEIKHEYLHNLKLDLSLSTDNLLLMNASAKQNSYYGTIVAAVDGRVNGTLDDINVVVDARTRRGSNIVMPFDQKRSVKQVDYIQFVDPYNDALSKRHSREGKTTSASKYHVVANVAVTPDAKLRLPVDYSQMLVDIYATGGGDFEVSLSDDRPLNVLGEYEIQKGTLDLTMMSLLGKKFSIEEGSVITFPGSIANAAFDIRAIYSQRVNLSTLTGTATNNASQTKVQVENVIAVTGNLQEPAINFDIRLPNADQGVQEEVFSYIDRSNDKDILNQTMSLLLLSQFYNANTTDAGNGINGGSNLVANSIGSVVSSMIDFVDVNIDYKTATNLVNEQVEVDIAKQWDKVYFEGAFGYGGMNRNMTDVNIGNNLIGDMLLGYKFSPTFHLYVFNRSNTNDYTRSDLPYKQGVGLRFTKDFDRFGDLFRSQKQIQAINDGNHSTLLQQKKADKNADTTIITPIPGEP